MRQFGMTTKTGKDLIMLTRQDTYELALEYFSEIKRLPVEEFNKIFVITEIKKRP